MKKTHYIIISSVLGVLIVISIILAVKIPKVNLVKNDVSEKNISEVHGYTEPESVEELSSLSLGDALLTVENYVRGKLPYESTMSSPVYESQNHTYYLISVGVSDAVGFGAHELYKVSKSTGEVTFVSALQDDWMYFEQEYGEFMDVNLNDYQLIEYAKIYLTTLNQNDGLADNQYTGNGLKYLMADFSGDGLNELVACGMQDGNITYFEMYMNNSGRVELIKSDHTGYQGHNGGISYYNNNYYVFYESWSSGDGFLVKLSQYDSNNKYSYNPWKQIYSAHTSTALDSNYDTTERFYVNELETSPEEYQYFRETLMNSVLAEDDLSTIKELEQ